MDYKAEYEEAVERARNELKQDLHESGIGAIKRIFPELRESEEGRIRKALICHLNAGGDFKADGVTKEEMLAYLEKQKEQKQEWSEEDELMRTAILNTLDRVGDYGTIGMQKDWLKSLRAQPHWKPSEEQMNALEHVLEMVEEEWGYEEIEVRSLIADLKKLMED